MVNLGKRQQEFREIMDMIANLFLRAKHWQMFLLFAGVAFIGDVVALASSMSAPAQSPEDFGKLGLSFGIVMVLFMFCFLGWFWSMGSFLSSIVQPALKLNTRLFHFALVYPALYVFVFIALFQSSTTNPALLAIIFPLHFFAMFCIFYALYFVSKSLVLAETNKPVTFYDYAGPFFLIWFFPVGVWFIQPRINRLYAERKNIEPLTGGASA